MKPDQHGTITQQLMFRAGWSSKGTPAKKCKLCMHVTWTGGSKPRCSRPGSGDFQTQANATCDYISIASKNVLKKGAFR